MLLKSSAMLQPSNRQMAALLTVGLAFGFCLGMYLFDSSSFSAPLLDQNSHLSHEVFELELAKNKENHPVHVHEDTDVQKELYDGVRVLCLVLNEHTREIPKHTLATWGKRCNKLIFLSSEDHDDLKNVVVVKIDKDKPWWARMRDAFKYIYENHLDDADWFLKANDENYVVMENLRYFLYPYDTNYPIYFGCHLKSEVPQGHMDGGSGFVLSKEALKRFVEKSLPDPSKCSPEEGNEDIKMGHCLANVGVKAGDARDDHGKSRFLPFKPEDHLFPSNTDFDNWFYEKSYYPPTEGLECCSDYAISFHKVGINHHYGLEYLIYHLKPYGIVQEWELPSKTPIEEMEKSFNDKNLE